MGSLWMQKSTDLLQIRNKSQEWMRNRTQHLEAMEGSLKGELQELPATHETSMAARLKQAPSLRLQKKLAGVQQELSLLEERITGQEFQWQVSDLGYPHQSFQKGLP